MHASSPSPALLTEPALGRVPPRARTFLRETRRAFRRLGHPPVLLAAESAALCRFLRWLGAPPAEATSADLRDYLDLVSEAGAGRATAARDLETIRLAYDVLRGIPLATAVSVPRRLRLSSMGMLPSEVQQTIGAAATGEEKLLLALMYAIGLRPSEACHVRWSDFDLERRRVRVGGAGRGLALPPSLVPLVSAGSGGQPSSASTFSRLQRGPDACLVLQRALAISGVRATPSPMVLAQSAAAHLFAAELRTMIIEEVLQGCALNWLRLSAHESVAGLPRALSVARGGSPGADASPNRSSAPQSLVRSVRNRTQGAGGELEAEVELALDAESPPLFIGRVRWLRLPDGSVDVELPLVDAWPGEGLRGPRERRALASERFFRTLAQDLVEARLCA